jgi:hypothetical protein
MMTPTTALTLWKMLSTAGADAWIDGGWGFWAMQPGSVCLQGS